MVNQPKETEPSDSRNSARRYSSVLPVEEKDDVIWRQVDNGDDLELSVIGNTSVAESVSEELLLEDLKVPLSLSLSDTDSLNESLFKLLINLTFSHFFCNFSISF